MLSALPVLPREQPCFWTSQKRPLSYPVIQASQTSLTYSMFPSQMSLTTIALRFSL